MSHESTNVMVREGCVLSVDLFRGVIMFLLIGKVTGIYDLLAAPAWFPSAFTPKGNAAKSSKRRKILS